MISCFFLSSFSLDSNFTLHYMSIPLNDVTQAYRSAPEKIDQALTRVGHLGCDVTP